MLDIKNLKAEVDGKEILKGLNYSPRGGAFRILKERILKEQIDDSHILRGGA